MLGIKKIDTFVLKKFFLLFLGCFCICLFVFMMQFVWKHVNDLVGKGLGIDVLAQFFWYMALSLVPMALPMAVLLTSLISFGNMGEQLELTAFKAAGVPLVRIMRSVMISCTLLMCVSFYFQNNISPKAQMQLARLLISMKDTSPALEIPEGVFYNGIPNVNLYVERKTAETDIAVTVDLDGVGESTVDTGLKFFDHMLTQLVHHGGIALSLTCKGDLEVDEHHTMEDCAIALGEALREALGDKRGIGRYGFALPMDESRALVLLDFGGRSELVWDVQFTREYVGDTPTEMFRHFFKSLSDAMHANLYVQARGENNHHLAEGIFKAFARSLRQAVARNVFSYELPSSKGLL